MNRKLMELAEKYVAQRKRRMRLLKTVTALALVVAICTSYVLMMPGLTMAAETYCGLEEHTHTADCYVDELTCLISEREAETVFTDIMRCSFEPHHHSSDCYNAQGELSCGYWDGYIHEHDEKCYDSNGVLICTLEEHPMHKHTDACYNWEKQLICTLPESEGHIHTDACYRAKEPTCGLFESEGHQHTADCVTETRTLICTEDVATNSDMPHVHDDSCYEVTRTYTCGLTEGEGAHHHTDACYPTTEEPTCGLLEGEGAHTHDDSCYEMVRGDLKCKLYPDPAKVHTHSASCVDAKTGYYTCGYIQVLRHQHTNECIVTVTAEDSGHHHTADCYERHYICGKEEHTHTADCYYDPTPNPDATAAPEATAEPTAAPEGTAEPTVAPEVTAEPTAAPEVTAEPTAAPEVTAEPTAAPEVTDEPTAVPEVTAEPTEAPEVTAEPTAAPTATPAPTEEPTIAPAATPEPTENTAGTAAPMDEPSPTPALTVIPSMDADAAKPDDMMMPSLELDPGFLMMANEPPAVSESGMQITNITVSNITLPENANAYNYSFAADFKISDEAILRHGEGNKIIIPAENTHIKADSTSVWSGTDAKFSNEKPAFKFQYNPETNNVEMWFTDEYMDFVRNNPSHDDRTGTMKMSAEIRKDDVENLGNDDLTIKFGGASTTVKWEDIDRGNNSLLSDLRTWKSGANVNWEKGTIEYTVKIESTKGTNGKNATARDVMTAVNKQIALTNMTVTEVKIHSSWNQVPAVDSASTEIKTDGSTCACGTTGTHIHYVYANTTDESGKVYTMTTDYVLPPLSANETYEIKYEYTFDKDGMTGEYDQLTNTFTAQSGGKWDHSQNSSNSNPTDVQIKKLQKSSWYNSNEGCIQWTLTVNENRFNIKDKTLTDTMFDQLVDENGNLLFSKTDGKGYVSQITANNTPITAENYTDYFTVETGADGKPQLKFKDTTAKIVIQYKTPVEATAQNQQITNTAEFDGEQKTSTAHVGQDERYNVVKSVDASMPADPTKNGEYTDGLYPVAWNATYTFPATKGVSYKLNFGDKLEIWTCDKHYMTKEQAQDILNKVKASSVGKAHENQNIAYKIVLYTVENGQETSLDAYTYDGTNGTLAELPEGKYSGFTFETTGEGVVLNDANTDVNATTSVMLPYQTTIYLEKSRTGWVDFKNTAVNAGKNGDAWYKAAPNDLVEKKFGNHGVGDLNGQIIHENELYWTILLRNDGVAHDEITLTETLPPHIVVDYIEYGRSRLILSETDSTKMTVVNKKLDNAGTIPNGYEVSNEWSEQRISIKADLTTVGEGAQQQQRINISMKPNENTGGSETILNGKADMTVKVHCKIADDFLANAVNGSLELGVLNNQLDVRYDAALYHKEQKTELTYEEETVKPINVQKGFSVRGGDQQARITYTIDINQAGAELSPSSSTLTLTDTLSYDVVGWCNNWPNNYIYLRDVTLDEGSFRLYEALKDENGNPILNVDENGKGHLVRGAEIEKYLWKMEFTETEEGNKTYQYPAQGTPSFSGSTVNTRKLNITVTVPDGKALILEYTAQENILLPPEVTNEYNFNDVNHKGINPALRNHANLEGKDSSSTELNNSNNDYFSQGGGYIHNNLVIRKVDSANTSLLLPGTEFTLYAWNTATNKFEAVGGENGKVYTDQNGMITYQYNSAKLNERPLDPNVAYMLAETDAVEPYHLVLEDRPLVVFHIVPRADDTEAHPVRYPDGLNNGNFGTISKSRLQELMTASGIKGVVDGPHTVNGSASINIQVKNSKDRHDMEVQKNWAGDDAHENARPASVLVMLRRYVLTQEQYTDVLNTGATQNPQCILSAEMVNNSTKVAQQFPENQDVTLTLNLLDGALDNAARIVARVDGKEVVLEPQDTSRKQFVYTTKMTHQKKVIFCLQWKNWEGKWTDGQYNNNVSITMTPEGTPVDEVPTQVTQFTDAQWAKIRQHPDDAYGGREATLTAANGWRTKWSQLESTGADANGNKLYYIYYIVEGKVPSYTTSGITYTIDPNASKTTGTVTATLTNVYRPEDKYGEISIDLSKEWYAPDGTKHTITEEFGGVQVALYKTRWDYVNGAWTMGSTERRDTVTLAEANKWSAKFEGLETYTVAMENGVVQNAYAYTYSLRELNVPSGFYCQLAYSGLPQHPSEYFTDGNPANPKADAQNARGTATLRNYEIAKLTIEAEKRWGEGAKPENMQDTLTFRLTREKQENGAWVADDSFQAVTRVMSISSLNTSKVVFGTFPKYAVTGFDEQNQPIRQSYRYKVEEVKYQNEATLPFSVSYSPADGFVTTEGDANTSTTVTVTNNKLTSEKEGLYRFNVAKQWLDASGNPADKPTPEGTKAKITVTRTRHVYAPDTGWTAETPTAKTIELDTTATYTALWAEWNETQSVYAQYNADGTVKSAWAYTYEVSEAAIDGYFGTQHLPADFPKQPSDYFTDAALTDIKEIYRQPLTDTLPEVTEKNYYVERFNVKVDKTWARFRDRDELTFCLIQAKRQLTFDSNGKPIKTDDQQYTFVTKNWTEGGAEPVWEFNNLPKYYFTVNENGEAQKKPYYYYIVEGYETINGALNPYLYQVSYTGDATLVKKTTGAVNQPADGGTANIHAKNLPGYEVGNLNLNLTKEWVNVNEKPERVTLNLTETTHSWTKEAGWITYDPSESSVEIMPDANGNWTTTKPLEAYYVEYNPDGSIHTAYVYTYELTEAPVSGTLPSYTFSENWPKEVGDVLELNSAGEPIKAKDAFKASSSQMEGSFLVTIADASATITNVQTGKINIEKKWAAEPAYDGAQNPLDIKQVSISLFRNVWGENWTDSDGVVHYDWCYDPFQQKYVLTAENGWKLTIDNLPLYDTTLNPDGSLRKYRYYIIENTSVGNDTLDRYTPVITSEGGEIVGSFLYLMFKDTTESDVTITNVPKSISIVKQWADADTFGEEGMMQDIYLEVMMKYQEVYSTQWKTENLLEKSYFSLKNVICTPSSLTAELVQINGAPYLHVSGLAKADEPWRVTIRNLPGYGSASFIIREVELAGYLNNLPDGKLELGFNEIGTITNTPTKLKITKQFKQAYFPAGSESELPLNVRNTVVYLQIWREKRDGAGLTLSQERYTTPLLGALEANMDATLLSDGTVKLTVGTNTPTDAATLTLTRLPRYWFDKDTGASGEWYYYVKEVDAEGNEVHSASAPTNGERPEINLNVKTLTVTNTLTDVSARKVWTSLDNQFTLNPANLPDITLTLKQTTAEAAADGDKTIATVTLGWDAEAGKVVTKKLDGWQFGEVVEYTAPEGSKNIWWGYKWYNLPAYDAGGNIYRYYAKEQTPVGSGWQLVTDDTNATNTAPIPANSENRVFQITNTPITYTLPETGGIGTLPYTAGGLLLMAAAALLLGQEIKRRREGC